jgi:transcriptional regulator GlxA family with amidase domain
MTATPAAIDTTDITLTVELPDGTEVPALTTAELAVLFGMSPRRLRRNFRAAGVGCGKGSIYATTAEDAQAVLDTLNRTNA